MKKRPLIISGVNLSSLRPAGVRQVDPRTGREIGRYTGVMQSSNVSPLAGPDSAQRYTNKILAMGPIQYLPMTELSGSVALDASGNGRVGAYTGVTLNQAGIGDGRPSAGFDGATSYNNAYSAGLALAFSGAAGAFLVWCKVNAPSVWTDGVTRRVIYFLVDSSNRVGIFKPTTSNEIDCLYVAGGVSLGASKTSFNPTGWFHLGLTWNKVADQLGFYVNGVIVTEFTTGLGTFAGSLSSTQTLLGSLQTGVAAQVWNGFLAHAAVFNRAPSSQEMLAAATL
jgi:hypothetical protein